MTYGWRPIESQMVELCDECGYDGRLVADQASAVAAALGALDELTHRADAGRRPDADTFSADEYAAHSVEVTTGLLGFIADVTGRPLPWSATDLDGCAELAAHVLPGLTEADRLGLLSGVYPFDATVDWIVQHLHHDLEHHVLDVRRGYARLALAGHPGGGTIER